MNTYSDVAVGLDERVLNKIPMSDHDSFRQASATYNPRKSKRR